jgi:lysophospholipase
MNIKILKESYPTPFPENEYNTMIDTVIAEWLPCVSNNFMESYDGMKINYYHAIPDNPQGMILFIHGFGEFYAKYHELSYLFYQAGYAFVFPELRGHGLSGREVEDPDIVHVDSYNKYVKDIHQLCDNILTPMAKRLSAPIYVFAHSMGGAITCLYLEKYPDYFQKAVLSVPMLKIKKKTSDAASLLALTFLKLLGKNKQLAPTQTPFDENPNFEESNCLSRARYFYIFNKRLEFKEYRTQAGSTGWLYASIKAIKQLQKNTDKIKTPILLFQAGIDPLVDETGQNEFIRKVSQHNEIQVKKFKNAKHELYSDTHETISEYLHMTLEFLEDWG